MTRLRTSRPKPIRAEPRLGARAGFDQLEVRLVRRMRSDHVGEDRHPDDEEGHDGPRYHDPAPRHAAHTPAPLDARHPARAGGDRVAHADPDGGNGPRRMLMRWKLAQSCQLLTHHARSTAILPTTRIVPCLAMTSVDCITAPRHAGAERAIVIGSPRAIAFCCWAMYACCCCCCCCPCSCASSLDRARRIIPNRPPTAAPMAAPSPALPRWPRPPLPVPRHPARLRGRRPERLLGRGRVHGRGRRHGDPRIRRVEAGLLHGPAVALALVRFLLLW